MLTFVKFFSIEFILIFLLVFSINNYFGNSKERIVSDGIGYYDYLPSIFIYNDFFRNDVPLQIGNSKYERITTIDAYVPYKEFLVNKYACGTAVLNAPFFLFTLATTDRTLLGEDGFQKGFQKSVYYAAIFYLFLGLIFFRLLLKTFDFKSWLIIWLQLLLIFATSMIQYVNYESVFSHVHSFFAITAFLFFSRSYFMKKEMKYFFLSALLLGLVLILRQVNLLILLSLPFIAGSWENFRGGVKELFNKPKLLFIGLFLVFAVCCIQFMAWYFQTGSFLVYSYQGENFDFSNPHFFQILFSFKKGLFIYSPILILSLFGLYYYFKHQQYYLFGSWLLFFIVLTFVLSSWWSWYYGCSFGLRAYIDFYALLFIPIGVFILHAKKAFSKFILIFLSTAAIGVSAIQIFQYNQYILHWIDMDREKYFKVFLRTDEAFEGILWKTKPEKRDLNSIFETELNSLHVEQFSEIEVLNISLSEYDTVTFLGLSFWNDFDSFDKSRFLLVINDKVSGVNYYYHVRYAIHFHDTELGQFQKGEFIFKLPLIEDYQNKELTISIITEDRAFNFNSPYLTLYQ